MLLVVVHTLSLLSSTCTHILYLFECKSSIINAGFLVLYLSLHQLGLVYLCNCREHFPPLDRLLMLSHSVFVFLIDNIRRRHAWFHQSTEEQIPLQEVLRQASSAGLLTCADGSRRWQHGNVSNTWASLSSEEPRWVWLNNYIKVWLQHSTNPPPGWKSRVETEDSNLQDV